MIAKKLKLIKAKIKKWNREAFDDIKIQKYNLMDSINQLDVKEETSGLSNEELEQRKADRNELAKVIRMHEIPEDKTRGHCGLELEIGILNFFIE